MPARVDRPADKEIDQVSEESAVCRAFIDKFGRDDAIRILKCGLHHWDRIRSDDYFLDCLVVAIGYKCMTEFHEVHGFDASTDDLIEWIKSSITRDDLAAYEKKKEIIESHRKQFIDIFGS